MGGQNNLDEKCKEEIIAENIYDWWTSKKSYEKWYNDKFQQQTLNFKD